jgi:hypothetical protein
VFRIPFGANPLLISAIAGTQLLQIAVLGFPPVQSLLSLDGLTLFDGVLLAGAGMLVLAVMETYKLLRRA